MQLARKPAPRQRNEARPDCRIASIGPVTTAALKRHGLKPHITPATHDIPGMVKAIADYFAK